MIPPMRLLLCCRNPMRSCAVPIILPKDVREREREELQMVRRGSANVSFLTGLRLRDPAVVRELHALGPTSRARRVDERRERVPARTAGGALLYSLGNAASWACSFASRAGQREAPATRPCCRTRR